MLVAVQICSSASQKESRGYSTGVLRIPALRKVLRKYKSLSQLTADSPSGDFLWQNTQISVRYLTCLPHE